MNRCSRRVATALTLLVLVAGVSARAFSQEALSGAKGLPDSPQPAFSISAAQLPVSTEAGTISGTVLDVSGTPVPGATVELAGVAGSALKTAANEDGVFTLESVPAGAGLRVVIHAKGFQAWTSAPMTLAAGQTLFVKDIQLKIADAVTSVTVTASTEQIATEQVSIEEKQRIFGIIPNYYVVYDSENVVPMTTKLKFQMALRVSIDPISFAGALTLGAIDQASDTPGYPQGWKGYGQRVGAVYTDGFTDTMLGGAILPSLLHQDPRYYYQGTGTVRSRALHALEAPFVCKGDNGKWQPNVSSIGGDLISASISTAYYPQSDRGAGLLFENVLIETAERGASTLIQEFLLRRWTPSAKGKN